MVPEITAIRAARDAYEDGRKVERDRVEWVLARFEAVLADLDGTGGDVARLTVKSFRTIWEAADR